VYRDAQPVAADGNLVHPLDDSGSHRLAIDRSPQRAAAVLNLAGVAIEAQDGVTGSYVDILQADHHTRIAPDGHLG
jgi:hypothetical protein